MDQFNVPKKINRHVIKAVYELADQASKRSDLLNICDIVEIGMKNNVPVANLRSVVRQSLQNLWKLGVIKKQGTKYYRPSENLESLPHNSTNRINSRISKRAVLDDEEINSLNPDNKKRRLLSEDSVADKLPSSSKKRRRNRSKPLSRKGKRVHLPKVRKHDKLQLSHTTGEIEQDSCSSSCNEDENKSEDENEDTTFAMKPNFGSEMFETEMFEEIGFSKTSDKSSENLMQTFEDNIHQEQNYQPENIDDPLIHGQINELNVLNEMESQLDSESFKTSNDNGQEEAHIAFNTKEDSMMTNTNNKDGESTEKINNFLN